MRTIIIMILFTSICSSTTLTINTDTPYSYGSFTWATTTRKDSATFSNGITINNALFQNYDGSRTTVVYVWGIFFDSSSDLIKVGTSDTEYFSWIRGGYTQSGKSYDTNWLKSDTVPSKLAPLPERYYKWYCDQYYNYVLHPLIGKKLFNNYKNIIYAQSKKNYIKLQISDIILSPTDSSGLSDSVKISWMVDSLGNGKFKTPVSINRNANISSKNFPKTGICRTQMIGFNTDRQYENIIGHKMFSINGKVIKSPLHRIPEQISILKE